MPRAAPWLVRIGAVLLLVAPFLPQADSGGQAVGARSMLTALAPKLDGVERFAVGAILFLPVAAGAVLLAGTFRPGGGSPALRLTALGLLLAVSFALSTLGSLLLTDTVAKSVSPSFPLSIALFSVPLVLSGAALARWMQGGLDRQTGAWERGGLAVLLLLHGLVLADCGWAYLSLPLGVQNGTLRPLAGAWIAPLGAVLAAVGALLPAGPPRAAVDTAAASG